MIKDCFPNNIYFAAGIGICSMKIRLYGPSHSFPGERIFTLKLHPVAWLYKMTSTNGNVFRVTGPLCGEFTGPGEFPTQINDWVINREAGDLRRHRGHYDINVMIRVLGKLCAAFLMHVFSSVGQILSMPFPAPRVTDEIQRDAYL